MSRQAAEKPALKTTAGSNEMTGWHISTISLLMLGYACYYFCRSDYSVALPLILAEQVKHGVSAHVAEVRLGSIASFGVLAYAIGKFPSGAFADRFGGRNNFLGGMAGSIFFTLLFMLGGGFPIFTIAWIGNRLVQSLGWAGLVKVTSRWFSYTQYGGVMAVISLSYLFGDALSRGAMSLLLAHGAGWRELFGIGAALLCVVFIANIVFLRETPAVRGLPLPEENPLNLFSEKSNAQANQRLETQESKSPAGIFRTLLGSPTFWMICLISLGTTLLRETFNLWTPMYFTQIAGMTNSQAASGSALFPFFGGISVLAAGFLSDQLGPDGRSRILFAGLACSVLALLGLAECPVQAGSLLPVALVSAVGFFLIGPYSYLAGAISLDFGGREGSATASGIIDGIGYLAGVLSGNGMAQIAVRYGWQRMFLVLAATAFLSCAVAGVSAWQVRQRSASLRLQTQP